MLAFFRRIRLRLLGQAPSDTVQSSFIDSETGRKYLLYAVGEIALVVIGILIALQINNWNQQRQLKKVEMNILIALANEFESNKTAIQECSEVISQVRLFADSIRMQLGPQTPSLSIHQMNY